MLEVGFELMILGFVDDRSFYWAVQALTVFEQYTIVYSKQKILAIMNVLPPANGK